MILLIITCGVSELERSDSAASHTRPHATRIPAIVRIQRHIMTSRTYRIDDRARRVPREPRSRGPAVVLFALTILARPASAKWLGGTQNANGRTVGESRQGNTRIVQETAGTPVATQIAYDKYPPYVCRRATTT